MGKHYTCELLDGPLDGTELEMSKPYPHINFPRPNRYRIHLDTKSLLPEPVTVRYRLREILNTHLVYKFEREEAKKWQW